MSWYIFSVNFAIYLGMLEKNFWTLWSHTISNLCLWWISYRHSGKLEIFFRCWWSSLISRSQHHKIFLRVLIFSFQGYKTAYVVFSSANDLQKAITWKPTKPVTISNKFSLLTGLKSKAVFIIRIIFLASFWLLILNFRMVSRVQWLIPCTCRLEQGNIWVHVKLWSVS